MKNTRPVNLDLSKFRFPVTALASITHRVAGVILFVAIAFVLWALTKSLESKDGFEQVSQVMTHPLAKFVTWGILSAIAYHFIAGIKHLLMDAGFFETLETGPVASKVVFVLAAIAILSLGVWVW
ncbi:succinate dehydrogenase, cytochrome b556 subunit [Reinekea forsetii]|nr:succinate dehydrogenase, cytochrome b556 subunit [Reinekea forsetii]